MHSKIARDLLLLIFLILCLRLKKMLSLQPDWDRRPDPNFEFLPDDFELASDEAKENFIEKAPPVTYWQDAVRRFKQNTVAMFALGLLLVIILFAFVGPLFFENDYTTMVRGQENLGMSLQHPFGTDKFGRDVFSRIVYATRVSLLTAVIAVAVSLLIVLSSKSHDP